MSHNSCKCASSRAKIHQRSHFPIIDAVGSDADIMKLKTDSTKVVDLQGKMVVPGFTDDHVHLWFGSLALHGFNLSTPESTIEWNNEPDLFAQKIKEYADSHPNDEVLIGRASFSNGVTTPAPTHEILDKIVPDRPLVIHATSEHTLWLNEKALELAGITDKPLPDPSEEKYVMRDLSKYIIFQHMPVFTNELLVKLQ